MPQGKGEDMKSDMPQSEEDLTGEDEYRPASEKKQNNNKPQVPKEKLAPHPQQY